MTQATVDVDRLEIARDYADARVKEAREKLEKAHRSIIMELPRLPHYLAFDLSDYRKAAIEYNKAMCVRHEMQLAIEGEKDDQER